jgi:hypothetical protein
MQLIESAKKAVADRVILFQHQQCVDRPSKLFLRLCAVFAPFASVGTSVIATHMPAKC